jgi:hypothetical protein
MYYVYTHIRLDTNEPFYVGKGKNRRAYSFHPVHRNKYWTKIYLKCNKNIKVILEKENLTEEEALREEINITNKYLDLGYKLCHICNPGSKGSSGHTKSEEWKKWYSNLMSSINKDTPKKPEHKTKIAKALQGREGTRDRPVNQKDLEGNFIKRWNSAKEAERSFKIYPNGRNGNGINHCCRGVQTTAHGYKWEYTK